MLQLSLDPGFIDYTSVISSLLSGLLTLQRFREEKFLKTCDSLAIDAVDKKTTVSEGEGTLCCIIWIPWFGHWTFLGQDRG